MEWFEYIAMELRTLKTYHRRVECESEGHFYAWLAYMNYLGSSMTTAHHLWGYRPVIPPQSYRGIPVPGHGKDFPKVEDM